MRKIPLFLVFVLFLFANPSLFAYIDPGTGSLLVSAIIGIGMAVVYFVRGFFYSILARILGRNIEIPKNFTDQIVFFNEGKNYWAVFQPILNEFIAKEQKVVYISADKEDPGLNLETDYVETHCLGNMNRAIHYLNHIEADTLVMTTPQINILSLKRSKKVRHYCHVLHAPVDIHTYKKFAFDYFDSVLCSSSYQIENLRQLERDRNRKEKKLYETGCTYYDTSELGSGEHENAVLVAPTWGEKSFLKENGIEIIQAILDQEKRVIFRPHPQSWISDIELLEEIINYFKDHELFTVDREVSNSESLRRAEYMICDLSGVIYDFLLLYKKKAIAVKKEWDNGGYEDSDITNPQATISLLDEAGLYVEASELLNFSKLLKELEQKKVTEEILNDAIYNFQEAGPIAAAQILEIYKENKQ